MKFMISLLVATNISLCAFADLRVAMVLPGSDTDKGWNQMAREGLDRIKTDLHAQTQIITNVQSSDFYSRISNFAEDGVDVVICHGGEFENVVKEAAKNYPKTHFIVGGCPNEIPGAVAVDFDTKDASRLAGLLASEVTHSKTVAFVGAEPVAPLQACYDGMKEGLASGVTALPALWTNSWDSPTVARQKAEAAIASGADVIYQNVDAAAIGVFQAVQDANHHGKNIAAIGCNSNQNGMAPDVIVGSVVLNVQQAYLDLTKKVIDGKQANAAVILGLKGGYVDLVLNEKHPAITAAIKEKVDGLRKEILQPAGK
jgi:basic membrane lipoprotein Med (substrate-binding protein (PBP1-ABC) superfamily)